MQALTVSSEAVSSPEGHWKQESAGIPAHVVMGFKTVRV